MYITILTYGSRGDFQPFLALALGLQKTGHSVRLAAPRRFANTAAQYTVPFAALAGDPEVISVRFNEAGTNPVRVVKSIRDYVFEIAPHVVRDARLALEGADLVIHSFLFTTGGHTFARQMGIPDISVQTFPMFAPTRAFPNVAMVGIPPGLLSYFSHWLATQVFWHGGNAGVPRFSQQYPQDFPAKLYWPFRQVGNRPLSPLVFAYSPTILPRPRDWNSPHIHIPGYFFLSEPDYQPPSELVDFLAAGVPPVCISFGSMIHQDMESISHTILDALDRTGQRGLILTGWGGWKAGDVPENIFHMEAAPHAWLFPRCSAILHHGGAGTTAAGLRSGKPNVVIPFAGDQLFWGKRVAALGAGPNPIPLKKLDVPMLADAIRQSISDPQMRVRAADVGAKIRAEDGVGRTVQLVEEWAARFA